MMIQSWQNIAWCLKKVPTAARVDAGFSVRMMKFSANAQCQAVHCIAPARSFFLKVVTADTDGRQPRDQAQSKLLQAGGAHVVIPIAADVIAWCCVLQGNAKQ